ncbi:CLUMA_CG012411, isoform A [Clunio marinus]|uniref:CLUMA_CG012411, isoform A n=1 Tax=Clunio marinus TaxID=568069 RepID=A0A1J1IET9_9DIPT|nr:CLUMA_CG012411, isoform A [Clunio marinus]
MKTEFALESIFHDIFVIRVSKGSSNTTTMARDERYVKNWKQFSTLHKTDGYQTRDYIKNSTAAHNCCLISMKCSTKLTFYEPH